MACLLLILRSLTLVEEMEVDSTPTLQMNSHDNLLRTTSQSNTPPSTSPSSKNTRNSRHTKPSQLRNPEIPPSFPLFSFAQFLTMFAIRSAVAACHNGRFLIPSLSLSSRFFAEAASATQGEEKPEEHGDPEVIDFIKKVGSPRDCHF